MRTLITPLATLATAATLLLSGCFVEGEPPSQCLAYPDCGPDAVQVDTCDTSQPSCRTASICGSTIYCEDIATTCTAEPTCPPAYEEVDGCDTDSSTCKKVTTCGSTIFCQELAQCGAVPVCDEGWTEVTGCDGPEPGNVRCESRTLCGTTIYCENHITCDGLPVCPQGTHEVDPTSERCTQDDLPGCIAQEVCGQQIWCAPDEQCAPSCPAGSELTSWDDPRCDDGSCTSALTCDWLSARTPPQAQVACAPISCAAQEARGVGFCDAYFGVAFNGVECVGISGCDCEGADCDNLYGDHESCKLANEQCDQTKPVCSNRANLSFEYPDEGPICDGPDRLWFAFDGQSCVQRVQGCGAVCVGSDCGQEYDSLSACQQATAQCSGDKPVCSDRSDVQYLPTPGAPGCNTPARDWYVFNGQQCEVRREGVCEACVGSDCGEQYDSLAECQQATAQCGGPLLCQGQVAYGIGSCELFLGYAFTGSSCVGLSGCSCQGSDCQSLYQSEAACKQANAACIAPTACVAQDAQGVGACAAFFGYAFDGNACVGLSGCSCQGGDCDKTFQTAEACQQAYGTCALGN